MQRDQETKDEIGRPCKLSVYHGRLLNNDISVLAENARSSEDGLAFVSLTVMDLYNFVILGRNGRLLAERQLYRSTESSNHFFNS